MIVCHDIGVQKHGVALLVESLIRGSCSQNIVFSFGLLEAIIADKDIDLLPYRSIAKGVLASSIHSFFYKKKG
jgi:hypothetical protein